MNGNVCRRDTGVPPVPVARRFYCQRFRTPFFRTTHGRDARVTVWPCRNSGATPPGPASTSLGGTSVADSARSPSAEVPMLEVAQAGVFAGLAGFMIVVWILVLL